MKTQLTTLPNGLRIVSAARDQIESVSIGIWINTGSAYETEEINGISHFLEHMVFKGTKSRNAQAISEDIENKGGHTNAYTSREFTAFYARMLKDDTELALDVLSELLTAPLFKKEDVIKEREVVIQEIKQAYDAPDDIIFDYFQEHAFPNQPVGRTILGPEEKIHTFDDKTLKNYLKNNYAAENMVVCAVGNIDHNKLVKMVEKRLGKVQPKNKIIKQKQQYKGGFYFEKRDIEQVHLTLGFKGVNYSSDDYYPSVILSTILGGGLSSRLFQEIREKRGLVYTVYSFSNSHLNSGLFGIYAGTTEAQLQEVVPLICKEINSLAAKKVSKTELSRAKTQLKASILMSLESSSSTSEILARQMLLFNRIIPVEEMVKRIEKVTVEDVQKSAKQIFSSNPTYVLLGGADKYPSYKDLKCLIKV